MPFKKGQSGNPKGKPKGAVSKYVKVRDDFFKAYYKLGGLKNLLTLFEDRRWCRECGNTYPAEPYRKDCECGKPLKLQSGQSTEKEFMFKVLPGLMPKKIDLDAQVEPEPPMTPDEEALLRALLKARVERKLENPTG